LAQKGFAKAKMLLTAFVRLLFGLTVGLYRVSKTPQIQGMRVLAQTGVQNYD